jgi:hypothetical protein
MAKERISCDELIEYAYKARRQFTPKEIGERAKNLVSHAFNEFEKLYIDKAEKAGFTYNEKCFIVFQHLYIFLIMCDGNFYEEEYEAYKTFCEWARFKELSVEDFKNVYNKFTIEDIYNEIKELVSLRDQIDPENYSYFVSGLFYLVLVSKNSIHENEYNILVRLFEEEYDLIPLTYAEFKAKYN